MSLSLLQESSLDTEFAFHFRHQNAFLSHLCCYCEDVRFSSPVEGAPNFKMGASGDQEIPIWVVVAEQGDCVSRGVEEVRVTVISSTPTSTAGGESCNIAGLKPLTLVTSLVPWPDLSHSCPHHLSLAVICFW